MELCYYGNPILRQKAEPIEEIIDEIRELAAQMIETMRDPNHPGIGLAAPQIGRSIRMFVVALDHYEDDGSIVYTEPYVYINPKLSEPSEETDFMEEGCLSIPGFRISVERPVSVTIEAMNLDGEMVKERFHDLEARVRMHENDHINGILMHDRASPVDRKEAEPLLREIKKRYA